MTDIQNKQKPVNEQKTIPQKSSTEITGSKKETEKQQDKNPGRNAEVVERESPEVHSERDPRVN